MINIRFLPNPVSWVSLYNIHCLQHIIHIVFDNVDSKILRCTKIYPIKELYTGNKLFYIMNFTKLTSQSLKFQRFFPLGCL